MLKGRHKKKESLKKQAAKLGLKIRRSGPTTPKTFQVETRVLREFQEEVKRRGMLIRDAVSEALELWYSN